MTGEESYRLLADHYDLIHDSKPYTREAKRVLDHLDANLEGPGRRLLSVACGTGRHLAEFTAAFDCVGVDANPDVLGRARGRVPEARFVQADMRSLALDRTFDALTCLFGSIGYLQTWENLGRAVERFAAHLREGGAFVIESWIPPDVFDERGRVHKVRTYEDGGTAIARVAVAQPPRDGVSRLDIHWLITEDDDGLRHHVEEQRLGVFDVEETVDLLADHGLKARVHQDGLTEHRVLFVGRRVDDDA